MIGAFPRFESGRRLRFRGDRDRDGEEDEDGDGEGDEGRRRFLKEDGDIEIHNAPLRH